jgi:16S rRNA (cytosine967-C5)-methyltransferase
VGKSSHVVVVNIRGRALNKKPRFLCWQFLVDAEREKKYINLEIEKLYSQLERKDRPFATELIFGTVRQRGRLDHLLNKFLQREIDQELRYLLQLAAYEAIFMKTADHAIGQEYVEIAKAGLGKARATLVNAVIRKVIANRAPLLNEKDLPLSVASSHPEWIVKSFAQILPADLLERELQSHNDAAKVQIVSFESLTQEVGEKSPDLPYGYTLSIPPGELPEIKNGSAFVQDFGSQLICEILLQLDPDRTLRWLDMCAGPGGKFTYLSRFIPRNLIVGVEQHSHRANLIKSRLPDANIIVGDARKIFQDEANELFDVVVIDAPCSGLGALRRRPDARWRKTEAELKELIELQSQLLDSALNLLEPRGVIAYITCSPHILETGAQVKDFLYRNKNMKIKPIQADWVPDRYVKSLLEDGTLQLMTYRDETDGMFMALLERA